MTLDDDKYQAGEPRRPEQIEAGIVVSPDTHRANRIPPGQSRTRKWPVLHYGRVPEIPTSRWKLEIRGLVEHPLAFTWDEFQALPRVRVFSDFHCVTRWSRLDNVWEGVSVQEIARRAGIQPEAKFVVATGYDDGWTTNLPLSDFLAADALFADIHDGEPLSYDHGGPVRLIVPQLYAWKSAKWVRAVEFTAEDRPGFWEEGGYHLHGDPWKEERYRDDAGWFR
ncbi:MAG TPA: sulfite oxidase-like oxidoreductase [Planctomycetaceae bacterium]|nr:sulfite oxidase-like oxidoreductase [Planctomycetaceae bacterium]